MCKSVGERMFSHLDDTTFSAGPSSKNAISLIDMLNDTPNCSSLEKPTGRFPSLSEILHHCNIQHVYLHPSTGLDPQEHSFGLHLCLTKFPTDDVQRTNILERLKLVEALHGLTESKRTGFVRGPEGSKVQLASREGGAFQPVNRRYESQIPVAITIEFIEPNSTADREGRLSVGSLILEIDTVNLLTSGECGFYSPTELLSIAQRQLRNASRMMFGNQRPTPVHITAATYHHYFDDASVLNPMARVVSLPDIWLKPAKPKENEAKHITFNQAIDI